jgi:hypothetical protein
MAPPLGLSAPAFLGLARPPLGLASPPLGLASPLGLAPSLEFPRVLAPPFLVVI